MLGNIGYAFAEVTPIPEVDREDTTVAHQLRRSSPGPRVNVRRIVFKGNTRTADEVLRREMRQFEGAWYSQAAIDRSKIRLQRLGYFETVEVETPEVAGSNDQVDVVVNVKETTSGSFVFGLGYSQLPGLDHQRSSCRRTTSSAPATACRLHGCSNNNYLQALSTSRYLDPYFTDDGVSVGYNLW